MPPKRNHKQRKSNKKSRKRDTDIPAETRFHVTTKSAALPRQPRSFIFVQRDYSLYGSPLIGSSTTYTALAFTFKLASLSNSSAFQSLFDQYRIVAVDFKFKPRSNCIVSTASVSPPPLLTVIDYDNATQFTTANQALEHSNCTTTECWQSLRRVFRPRIAVAAYQGSFTGYANTTSWCDCAYPDIQHYGLKHYLGACSASFVPEWDLDVQYHVEFRNVI